MWVSYCVSFPSISCIYSCNEHFWVRRHLSKYQTTIVRLLGFVHMLLLSCHLHLMVFMTSSIFLMDDHYKFTLINYHLILCSRLNCHQILIKREWSIHKITSCRPYIWQDKRISMYVFYILAMEAPTAKLL